MYEIIWSDESIMKMYKWYPEESKIVLLLYMKKGLEWQSSISDKTPEIISVSNVLRGLDFYDRPHEESFRSKSSVRLKLANYKSLDPNYKGSALSNVAKGDKDIWNKYSNDIERLLTECKEIISVHLDSKTKKQEKSFIEYLLKTKNVSFDVNVIKDAVDQLKILNNKKQNEKIIGAINSLNEIINVYEQDYYKPHAGVNKKPIDRKKSRKPLKAEKTKKKQKENTSEKKIGEFVKETFNDLVEEKKITNTIIKNLLSADWCREVFHIGHSFLITVDTSKGIKEQLKDENGYVRYWITPKKIKGKDYCVCKEWYESNRKYYIAWLKTFEKHLLKYNKDKFLDVLLYIKSIDEKKVYIKTKDVINKYGNDVSDVLDYLIQRGVLSIYQDDKNLIIVDDYDLLYKMITNTDVYLKEGRKR